MQVLRAVTDFGSNPGNLRMLLHVPHHLARQPALVIALHGCGQTAQDYDHGTGWSALAEQSGFALIYPEQCRANNLNACFSWFHPKDTSRNQGEAASIQQMVVHAINNYGVDPRRVYVTGLSAGGAMASVLLATYPDVFAGGAIIAGLPYGAATSAHEAFFAMCTEQRRSSDDLGDRVRGASAHRGPWPTISIWHGTADTVVGPSNATQIVCQWADVHRLALEPTTSTHLGRHTQQIWLDVNERTLIEAHFIAGMGHGVPLNMSKDTENYGSIGRSFLDVGVSSTLQIARSWGLTGECFDLQRAA